MEENLEKLESQYPRYNAKGIDLGKYLAFFNSENGYIRVPKIGPNHLADGTGLGGFISSYNQPFENDDRVIVQEDFYFCKYVVIGDIKEAYEILNRIVSTRRPTSFLEKCECVMEAVNEYFGDFSKVSERLSYYPEMDGPWDPNVGKVSDLAHKNCAMCTERAMLSQNLLKVLGIKSLYKTSGFINNDKEPDVHCYNLVKDDGKYYIFDSTQPTLRDDIICPVVAEIPEDIYHSLARRLSRDGTSIRVKHYNPMQKKDYDVVYDAGWKKFYDASDSKEDGKSFY